MKVTVWHDGEVAASHDIVNLPIVSDFLGPGKTHTEPIDIHDLVWAGSPPVVNSALLIEVSGSLRVLGPWRVEYDFKQFNGSMCLKAI